MKLTPIDIKWCINKGSWCPFLSVSEDGSHCCFNLDNKGEYKEIHEPEEYEGEKPNWCKLDYIIAVERDQTKP